jgi:hypothetical protein
VLFAKTILRPYNQLGGKARVRTEKKSTVTLQTFRDLLAARPFKPFRLVMSSGQTYEVRHPEMAWLTRTSILVGIDDADDGVPAEFKICSLLHVTAVESFGPTPASPSQVDAG